MPTGVMAPKWLPMHYGYSGSHRPPSGEGDIVHSTTQYTLSSAEILAGITTKQLNKGTDGRKSHRNRGENYKCPTWDSDNHCQKQTAKHWQERFSKQQRMISGNSGGDIPEKGQCVNARWQNANSKLREHLYAKINLHIRQKIPDSGRHKKLGKIYSPKLRNANGQQCTAFINEEIDERV